MIGGGSRAALLLASLVGAAHGAEPSAPAPADSASAEPPKREYEILAEFVTDDSLSALRFFRDGLVTLNDRCPVRLVRLNCKMEAAYVNGRPVGFC